MLHQFCHACYDWGDMEHSIIIYARFVVIKALQGPKRAIASYDQGYIVVLNGGWASCKYMQGYT